jgi:hypothetical protein
MAADAMTKVREAVHLLEMALPGLPVGSEPHKAVLKMIQDGAKLVPSNQEHNGIQQTTLAGLGQLAQQNKMMQMLQSAMQSGGGGGEAQGAGPPGAAPASPPGM